MVRMARISDIPAILDIYAPYVRETTVSFEYDVPCLKSFTERFETITAQFPWLVFEEAGEVLGYAYGSPPFTRAAYRWCAEPTVYLRPDARGRGIARALYTVLEELLRRQGYQVLYAIVTSENAPSMRFHEKMGYTLRGSFPGCGYKLGHWTGINWYEKRVNIVQNPRGFPVPFRAIVQNEKNFSDILDNLTLF